MNPTDLKYIFEGLRTEANKVLVGLVEPFELLAVALFTGGHVLLEGVPGTAKTLMAKTLAHMVQAKFTRIQFTPDLMPSDILGTSVFDVTTTRFHLKKGPIFTQLLLADEINRAPAKTQSALLEAMEERQVNLEGERHVLDAPSPASAGLTAVITSEQVADVRKLAGQVTVEDGILKYIADINAASRRSP